MVKIIGVVRCGALRQVPPRLSVHLRAAQSLTGVIRPVLEYAAPVWNHLLSKTQIDQIEAIQRRALRIIYSYTNDMSYINALYCASIPSLVHRREQL